MYGCENTMSAICLLAICLFRVTALPTIEPAADTTTDDYLNADGEIDYDAVPLNEPKKLFVPKDTEPTTEATLKLMHMEARMYRMAVLRQDILSKLGLEHAPQINGTTVRLNTYPHHLMPVLEQHQETQVQSDQARYDDENHARISSILSFASQAPSDKRKFSDNTSTIYFAAAESVTKRNLIKATMLVYIRTPAGSSGSVVTLTIAPNVRKHKPLFEVEVKLSSKGHWEHFDVTEEYKEWILDEDQNYGLHVSAPYNGTNLAQLGHAASSLSIEQESREAGQRTPLIKLKLNQEKARVKRAAFDEMPITCHIDDQEKRCCRYTFVIDFDEMGHDFDFIVTPRRYVANYCAGMCPNYYLPSNTNSHLMMGMSGRRKMQRCCSPTKLERLQVIYLTENGSMIQGDLPGMTITKCGCS